jgi:hypothetical protein
MRSQHEAKVETARITEPTERIMVLSIESEYVFLRLMKNLFFLMIFSFVDVVLLRLEYQNNQGM